jgi:hypothetical protein
MGEVMNYFELAKQAGFVEYELDDGTTEAFDKRYATFAALVAAHEREACAKLCNDEADDGTEEQALQDSEQYRMQMAAICTAAIGYWTEYDSISPEYDTLALRDVAKLYKKYDVLYKAQQGAAAQDKLNDDDIQVYKDHGNALTIAYQSGYYDGKKAALAGREWNFCERCGKRTADLTVIHTCTPPPL